MRKKLSFLSGLATVILFLFSTAISTYAASDLTTTNPNTNLSVSGTVYGSSSGVTGDVYGSTGVTGDVYGSTGVTGDVYGSTGVTGDVYGGTGVTGDVYGSNGSPFVIDSVSVMPQTAVTAYDQVTVKVKAHGDQSGIEWMTAFFNDPSGRSFAKVVSLTYDRTSDDWVGTFYVGQNDMPGKWTLSNVSISDKAGNNTDVTVPATTDASYTVYNPNADYTAPVINSTKLSATSINVGEKVTITSDIKDDQSGVDTVTAYLYNQQGGTSYNVPMRYDAAIMKWVGTFEALETTQSGQWNVNISASDKAYNYTFLNPSDYPSFTVVNPTGDYTPPVISNVVADKTEVNAGDQITFTATVDDSQSGVSWVEGTLDDVGTIVFKKDNTTGKWVGTTTIPTNIADGTTLALQSINATDVKGNTSWGWSSVSFLVHNKTGDYTAPSLDDLQISSSDVTAGDQITIKVKVSDEQSGVKSVSGFLGNEANQITFKYDSSSELWVANYTIPSNLNPSQLELKIGVEDNNQNSNYINTGKYINISNPNADYTAPVIENVELTPSILNVGDKLNVAATITDNVSGVRYVEATIHSGSHYAEIPLTFDAAQNKWLGSYIIQANEPSGTWEFDLHASDNFFNNVVYSNVFNVNNPDGDISAPYVDSFTQSSNTANVGDTVHFETVLKDDQSGVKSAHLEIYSDYYHTFVQVPLSYDKTKDAWTADYTVPSYSTAGPHNIQIIADDNAGNEMSVPLEQRLLIFNDNPDNDAPIIGDVTVNLNKVAVGDSLEFKVKLSDSGSGVNSAYVEPTFQGGTTGYDAGTNPMSVPLEFDQQQSLWIGKYTIKSSDLQGTYNFIVYALDNAGNSTTEWKDESFTILRPAAMDKTSPITTASPVNEIWTNSDATITFTATDDLSGVARTEYRVNNGDWQIYTGTITVSQEGQNTVDYRSIDHAGNTEEMKSLTVKIDKTAPVTTITPVMDGWYNSDVTLNLQATDSLSGVAKIEYKVNDGDWQEYKGSIVLSSEGINQVQYRSIDNAGNVEETKTVEVKIDKTAPTLNVSFDQSVITQANHQLVPIKASVEANDDLSGIGSIELVSIVSNQPDNAKGDGNTTQDIQEAEFGTLDFDFLVRAERSGSSGDRIYTVTYKATDYAGNSVVLSQTIVVKHDN